MKFFRKADTSMHADISVTGWMREKVPGRHSVPQYFLSLFPCTRWILAYNSKWLVADLTAGITVGMVTIPQGLAYAKLAGLPVQYGLYTSFLGSLLYWVLGTSKDISIGTAAAVAVLVASTIKDVRHDLPHGYIVANHIIASALAISAGLILLLLGLLRLGWLINLVSAPALAAFVTSSSLIIMVSQLPSLLGIHRISEQQAPYHIVVDILRHISKTQADDALVGISALCLLILVKCICGWLGARYPRKSQAIFFVSSLRTVVVILFYTIISYIVNHSREQHPCFAILGIIPSGFSAIAVPRLEGKLMRAIAPNLPALCIVLLLEHMSIAKSLGRSANYTVDASQEMTAIGVANIAGSFLGAFPATGAFCRSVVQSKAGARTPLTGVFCAVLVLVAIYTLMPVFSYVPSAALAAVIIHAVSDLITPVKTLYGFWKISPLDAVIFLVGVFVAVFGGLDSGIFCTIGISMGLLLWRSFKAEGRFLGVSHVDGATSDEVGGGKGLSLSKGSSNTGSTSDSSVLYQSDIPRRIHLPQGQHDVSNPHPGIFIYRPTTGFNYTNAARHLDKLVQAVKAQTRPAAAPEVLHPGDRPWNDPLPRSRKKRLGPTQRPTEDKDQNKTQDQNKSQERPRNEEEDEAKPPLRAIILDLSPVDHVDLTAMQALSDARAELDKHTAPVRVEWHFADVRSRWIERALRAAEFGILPGEGDGEGTEDSGQGTDDAQQKKGSGGGDVDLEKGEITVVESSMRNTAKDDKEMGIELVERKSRDMSIEPVACCGGGVTVGSDHIAPPNVRRPVFHIDIEAAVRCAWANAMAME